MFSLKQAGEGDYMIEIDFENIISKLMAEKILSIIKEKSVLKP